MKDRETVIEALEYMISEDCTETQSDFTDDIEAAIVLLKEQEAVEPKKIKGYNPPMYTLYTYKCEECETPIMNKQPFCMGCGKPVKWE